MSVGGRVGFGDSSRQGMQGTEIQGSALGQLRQSAGLGGRGEVQTRGSRGRRLRTAA